MKWLYRILVLTVITALLIPCIVGCLGGGSGGGGYTLKSNSTVSGYAFVPEGAAKAKSATTGKVSPRKVTPPPGMVALANALVRLTDGSGSATTDDDGHYVINVLITSDMTKTVEVLSGDTVMVSYEVETKINKQTVSSVKIQGTTGNWSLKEVISQVADQLEEAEEQVTAIIGETFEFSGIGSATDKATGGEADLTWTAVTHTDTPISYQVFTATASGEQSFTSAPYTTFQGVASGTLSGLENTTYYIVVRAVTGSGRIEDDPNTVEAMVTLTDTAAPTWPTNIGVQAVAIDDEQAIIYWDAASDNTTPISYKIYYNSSSPATGGETVSIETPTAATEYDYQHTITGLTNGTTCYFTVHAVDGADPANEDDNTIEITGDPIGIPGAPDNVAAVLGDSKIVVNWGPPSDTGGTTITSYKVYRGSAPDSTSLIASGITSTSFDDEEDDDYPLEVDTIYYYQVSALNSVGEGPKSTVVSETFSLIPTDLEIKLSSDSTYQEYLTAKEVQFTEALSSDPSDSSANFGLAMIDFTRLMNDANEVFEDTGGMINEYIHPLDSLTFLEELLSIEYETARSETVSLKEAINDLESFYDTVSGTFSDRLDIARNDSNFFSRIRIDIDPWNIDQVEDIAYQDITELEDAQDDFKEFLDKLQEADQAFDQAREYFNRDQLNETRDKIEDGFDFLIEAVDIFETAAANWSQVSVNEDYFDRISANLAETKTDILSNKASPYDEKTIQPYCRLFQVPPTFSTILTEFYTSESKSSFTFYGLFPEGLPADDLNRVENSHLVIGTGVTKEEVTAYLDGKKLEFDADLSTPEANLGSALVIMYKLLDSNEDKIKTILDDLATFDFTSFLDTIEREDYQDQVDELKERLQAAKAAESVNFVILFKKKKKNGLPYDPDPFEITSISQLEDIILITRSVIDEAENCCIGIAETLSDAEASIKRLVTEGDLGDFAYDFYLNPNLLDFSDADQTQDYIDALRIANPDFLKLKTVDDYGVDGVSLMAEYRQDILDMIDDVESKLTQLKSIATNMRSLAEDDMGIDRQEWIDRFDDYISDVNEAYQSLNVAETTLSFSDVGDGKTINLSAWFDNVPDNLLTLYENYRNGSDPTFGGLYP